MEPVSHVVGKEIAISNHPKSVDGMAAVNGEGLLQVVPHASVTTIPSLANKSPHVLDQAVKPINSWIDKRVIYGCAIHSVEEGANGDNNQWRQHRSEDLDETLRLGRHEYCRYQGEHKTRGPISQNVT